jgi:malonyl-CoA O-methyltransferase
MTVDSGLVKKNFSRYPDYYHNSAVTQKKAASELVQMIASAGNFDGYSDILEIGCGTGFLSAGLAELFSGAAITVTDISPAMLDFCRNILPPNTESCFSFMEHDITDGCPGGSYDLVVSSLVFQWIPDFSTLMHDIHAHLKNGGSLIFATLTDGTFADIQRIFNNMEIPFPMPPLAAADELLAALDGFTNVTFHEEKYVEKYSSMKEFLNHIQGTGAGNATGRKVPVSALRKLIKEYDDGVSAEYRILFVSASR